MNSHKQHNNSSHATGLAVAVPSLSATTQPARGDFRVNPARHNGELWEVHQPNRCLQSPSPPGLLASPWGLTTHPRRMFQSTQPERMIE